MIYGHSTRKSHTMNTLRNFYCFLFWALLLSGAAQSYGQDNMFCYEMEQSFELPKNITAIRFYAPTSRVDVRYTRGNTMTIRTTLSTNIPNRKLVENLSQKGRYNWAVTQPQTDLIEAYPEQLPSELIFKNLPAKEERVYWVTIPRRIAVFKTNENELWQEVSTSFVKPH